MNTLPPETATTIIDLVIDTNDVTPTLFNLCVISFGIVVPGALFRSFKQ